MAKTMNLQQAFAYLTYECDRDVSWICNVFMTGGGPNRARTVKALARLIQAGHEISSLPYTMPYEHLLVDGEARTPEEVRTMADQLAARGVRR